MLGSGSFAATNINPIPYNVKIIQKVPGAAETQVVGTNVNIALKSGEASRPIKFVAKATDKNNDKVAVQVMYKKTTESTWHSFGSTNSIGPDGKLSLKNGLYDRSYNQYGWKPMVSGLAAGGSGVEYISMPVNLGEGSWTWRTRAIDSQKAYGTYWSAPFTINVSKFVAPTPPPATPAPAPSEPSGSDTGDSNYVEPNYVYNGGTSEGDAIDAEPLTPADTQAPTAPQGVKAEYKSEESMIDLSWEASTDNNENISYEIERTEKDKNSWARVNITEETSFSDFEFEPNKTYSYRLVAIDEANNKSTYSEIVNVAVTDIKPNVTRDGGGEVSDSGGNVKVVFPEKSVSEDMFMIIEAISPKEIRSAKGRQIYGNAYDIRAKNLKGEEVTSFKTQVKIMFQTPKAKSSTIKTGKIGYLVNDSEAIFLSSKGDIKGKNVWTLTDHFTVFFLSVEKISALAVFLKILLWLFIVGGMGAAGYFGYIQLQRQRYQKEHQEDYIYRH